MSNSTYHTYHLVNASPWPYLTSTSVFLLAMGAMNYFHFKSSILLLLGFLGLSLCFSFWIKDMISESTYQGYHNKMVLKGLKLGFMLFMVSEMCFFVSFFWAFFHSSLSPSIEMGVCWPPMGMSPLNPFSMPLLNTAILLSSGVTITWAHHSLVQGESTNSILGLSLTCMLGILFTFLQAFEYMEAPFCLSDSVYGSTFFVATGFHGLHVIVGTMFLLICLKSLYSSHFSKQHHFGFEAASWYWHFVDVVWLFLFVCMYWWGQ